MRRFRWKERAAGGKEESNNGPKAIVNWGTISQQVGALGTGGGEIRI